MQINKWKNWVLNLGLFHAQRLLIAIAWKYWPMGFMGHWHWHKVAWVTLSIVFLWNPNLLDSNIHFIICIFINASYCIPLICTFVIRNEKQNQKDDKRKRKPLSSNERSLCWQMWTLIATVFSMSSWNDYTGQFSSIRD